MTSYAYDKPYVINSASILLYKSSRKNAMCSDNINISHLINHENNHMISDNRILDQFISTIDSIVSQAIIFNHHLEISCYMDIGKASDYISANNITCYKMEPLRYHWDRVKFNSIESAINFVYSIYCMIYPYNHLHLANTIYENPSIKYHIKRFYHGGENSVSTI